MKWLGGFLVATVILGLTACGEPDEDRIPGPRLIEEGEFDVVATVTVDESGFDVEVVEIDSGEVVAFEVVGEEPTQIRGYVDDELQSDTGDLLPGETTLIRLTEPGEVTYEAYSDATLVVTVRDTEAS